MNNSIWSGIQSAKHGKIWLITSCLRWFRFRIFKISQDFRVSEYYFARLMLKSRTEGLVPVVRWWRPCRHWITPSWPFPRRFQDLKICNQRQPSCTSCGKDNHEIRASTAQASDVQTLWLPLILLYEVLPIVGSWQLFELWTNPIWKTSSIYQMV